MQFVSDASKSGKLVSSFGLSFQFYLISGGNASDSSLGTCRVEALYRTGYSASVFQFQRSVAYVRID
ncbi:hypothetical protein GWI33_011990 [Rhynchophorus ferrugineus]|uniref:Uncharacterized protein n=1 Tax=Rhynchophorus ferrugineus TaxID=354439 RepID=A0A834IRL8_RHYFE|nr:hypothetical protein GWI33_011990 [Rhynchophorus ferrugineus]